MYTVIGMIVFATKVAVANSLIVRVSDIDQKILDVEQRMDWLESDIKTEEKSVTKRADTIQLN